MLMAFGIANRAQLVIFGSLAMLLFISPLGREATHPIVLGLYRTLLIVITFLAIHSARREQTSALCPYFLGGITLAVAVMAASVAFAGNSRFESAYVFYQHIFFVVAFVALAHFQ